jgi:hypothetical protein
MSRQYLVTLTGKCEDMFLLRTEFKNWLQKKIWTNRPMLLVRLARDVASEQRRVLCEPDFLDQGAEINDSPHRIVSAVGAGAAEYSSSWRGNL